MQKVRQDISSKEDKAEKAKRKAAKRKEKKRIAAEAKYEKPTEARVMGTSTGAAESLRINKMLKNLDKQQIAIVTQVMTGRVALQYPDDTQRRTMVNCIRTSFPWSKLIGQDGQVALTIKPAVKG